MVPDIGKDKGDDTYGLVDYFYGPGRHEEHTDPHLVASWNLALTPDPGRVARNRREKRELIKLMAQRLDLPVMNRPVGSRPEKHVWHCPVRTAPGDRRLSDEEWSQVARRLMHASGLAEEGDDQAVRWVAVRHADDHIHILATLVRQDGRSPRHHNDARRVQAECRKIEKEWGLRELNEGDGTASPRPTTAEIAKADRRGQSEVPRVALRDAVRAALSGADSEEEFFTRLHAAGVLINKRILPSGDVGGYSVAAVGDRTSDGDPVWYAGSTLSPDLSLPKIRAHIAAGLRPAPASGSVAEAPEAGGASPAARARYRAADAADHALALLQDPDTDEGEAIAQLRAVVDVVQAVADTSPAQSRADLLAAAREFERAARSHQRAARSDTRALRLAAREIIGAGYGLGHGEDGGVTAMLLSTLAVVAVALVRWQSARGHAQQAAAAGEAAQRLRAAYRTTAARPMAQLRAQGRRLPAAARRRQEGIVRSTVTDPGRYLDSGSWDALAATLAEIEVAGGDAQDLLQRARRSRELESAVDEGAVLVWRLRRMANLPATASQDPRPGAGTRAVRRRPDQRGPGSGPTR